MDPYSTKPRFRISPLPLLNREILDRTPLQTFALERCMSGQPYIMIIRPRAFTMVYLTGPMQIGCVISLELFFFWCITIFTNFLISMMVISVTAVPLIYRGIKKEPAARNPGNAKGMHTSWRRRAHSAGFGLVKHILCL